MVAHHMSVFAYISYLFLTGFSCSVGSVLVVANTGLLWIVTPFRCLCDLSEEPSKDVPRWKWVIKLVYIIVPIQAIGFLELIVEAVGEGNKVGVIFVSVFAFGYTLANAPLVKWVWNFNEAFAIQKQSDVLEQVQNGDSPYSLNS